jgi:hypothetical protein
MVSRQSDSRLGRHLRLGDADHDADSRLTLQRRGHSSAPLPRIDSCHFSCLGTYIYEKLLINRTLFVADYEPTQLFSPFSP